MIFFMKLNNPSTLIKQAIDSVNEKIQKVCSTYEVDFSQVETWLIANRSEQYKKTENLFQAVDNNIYSKWLEGKAQQFELQAWMNVLIQWKESWIELLKQYWQAHQDKK